MFYNFPREAICQFKHICKAYENDTTRDMLYHCKMPLRYYDACASQSQNVVQKMHTAHISLKSLMTNTHVNINNRKSCRTRRCRKFFYNIHISVLGL